MSLIHTNPSKDPQKELLLLDKQDTACLKGIAILMMVFHHCFAFPQWYKIPVSFGDSDFLITLGEYGSCCIFIFAIITGYAYALHEDKSLLYSCKKITSFLFSYLFIVVIIYIFAYIITGYIPTPQSFLAEFSRGKGTKLMIHGWYVLFHVAALFLLPWYARLESATNIRRSCVILAIIVTIILFSPVSELRIEYMFPALILGYILARDTKILKILSKHSENRLFRYAIAVVAALLSYKILVYFRHVESMRYFALLSPILVIICYKYLLPLILTLKLNILLSFLGKHSMNIWFIHCIFTSRITAKPVQEFVYIYDNAAWIYLTTILLSLLASIIVSPLQTKLVQFLMEVFFTPQKPHISSSRIFRTVFLSGLRLLTLIAFRNLWHPRYYELSFDYKSNSPTDITIYYKRSDKSAYPVRVYSETYRTAEPQGHACITIPCKNIQNIAIGVCPLSDANDPIEVSNIELNGRNSLKIDLSPSNISIKDTVVAHQGASSIILSNINPSSIIKFKSGVNMPAGKKRVFIPENLFLLFLGILPLVYMLWTIIAPKKRTAHETTILPQYAM